MLTPLVSVVTPVYNGARYLRECIESVLAQTYSHWSYTILDNCSTDQTLAIAQDYARRDRRIRVQQSREFLPIIANHNRALGLIDAAAAYCKPLMADDRLYPDCIETLVSATRDRPGIGLVCSPAMTLSGALLYDRLPCAGEPVSYLSGRAACRVALLEERYFFGSPTSMLLRADLIRKRTPFYDTNNVHADEQSCYDILQESDFAFVHRPLVFVQLHADSHTSSLRNLESIIAGRLYALAKYGHVYLDDAEFARRFAACRRQYYARLAATAVQLPDASFWEFHRRMLAKSGAPLERGRLALAVALYGVRRLGSPVSLVRGIAHRLGA